VRGSAMHELTSHQVETLQKLIQDLNPPLFDLPALRVVLGLL